MNFDNIIGNYKNKELLNKIINIGKIAHSYMFVGPNGIGKSLFAKQFAKAILCINDDKPCNICKSCLEFENLNNPDFNIINPEENSIKIEQIRTFTKKVFEKPIVSKKKVYIINDSDKMTKEAQNSLLKTLEEPPEYITIILIVSNENAFLNTIKSRCMKINFKKLTDDEVKIFLEKEYKYKTNNDIIKTFDGSIERAIQLKDKPNIYVIAEEIFSNINEINLIDLINSKDKIFKEKEEVYNILDYINIIFFKELEKNTINKLKYINCMNVIERTKDKLKKNSNFDMTIDNFMMTVWEEINDKYNRS